VSVRGPIAPSERIQALDVLRGLALWGILWVNIQEYCRPAQGPLEGLIARLMFFFAQGNIYPLFLRLRHGLRGSVELSRANRDAL
jgi:uncharacterized membrane protein YeiB